MGFFSIRSIAPRCKRNFTVLPYGVAVAGLCAGCSVSVGLGHDGTTHVSQVRPFEHHDAPAVAQMFLRILRHETSADGGAALAVYLDDLFCGPYGCDGEIGRAHV